MSFILNALRKSEQERLSKQAESTGHKLIGKQEQIENKKFPTWLIALILINMCLLAYFIWSATQEKTSSVETKKSIVTEKLKPLTRDTVVSEKPPLSTPERTEALKDSVVALAKQKEQLFIAQQIKKRKDKIKKVKKLEGITPSKNKQAISGKKQAESVPVVERKIIDSPTPTPSNNNQSKTKKKENTPPFLSELPFEFRRSVPAIDFNVFVYSSIEKERFVMIDMKKSQAGQEILEGMVLKEIRKNSIVVEYKNKVFQIER